MLTASRMGPKIRLGALIKSGKLKKEFFFLPGHAGYQG
jgi:hypothetical protein